MIAQLPSMTQSRLRSIQYIAGFAAIEMNISEWRDELLDVQPGAAAVGVK